MTSPKAHLTPIQTREEMIFGVKRRLIGPDTNIATQLRWPGPTSDVKIVNDAYKPEKSYPYGPWSTPTGEEVLPQTPLFIYPMATLGPSMTDQVVAEVRDNGARLLGDAAEDESESGNDPHTDIDDFFGAEDDGDVDGADDGQAHILGAEQQSVGLSIRIPEGTKTLLVRLAGGTYEDLLVDGQPRAWWRRIDQSVELVLSASESSQHPVTLGNVTATIGADVRRQVDGTKICTVWVRNNGSAATIDEATKKTLFQTRLHVIADSILPYEPNSARAVDQLDLLYSDVKMKSVGHGCDSVVEEINGSSRASTVFMPVVNLPGLTPDIEKKNGDSYAVGMLDLAELNSTAVSAIEDIINDYTTWIADKRREIPALDTRFTAAATLNIDNCQKFLNGILRGWGLVQSDPVIRRSLCDASRAMNQQRHAYGAPLRPSRFNIDGTVFVEGVSPHSASDDLDQQAKWRPFQLAFLLASIEKVIDPNCESRGEVDVIWMPTGGGKTEAYLGLSAFSILWEKATQTLGGKPSVRQTKVFMRYTLRLLTVQQITRAASLICALELMRKADLDTYGSEEIRIGAWLGSKVTPNKWTKAVKDYKDAISLDEHLKFLLRRCPWCGTEMGGTSAKLKKAIGYHISLGPTNEERIQVSCPDTTCPFTHRTITGSKGQTLDRGIPLFEVDEDVYLARPDFIVGTIDKVARIGWVPASQRLFGLHNGSRNAPPPSLFIQDELHLISGPLGSVDGSFEAMLEHLCEVDGGQAPIIIAATATTKNFESQVENLYLRSSRVVPPPGLTIEDSFFAKRDEESIGKTYVAVCSNSNFTGASSLQSLVLAMLTHQAAALEDVPAEPDPYWTNVVFFSSRRSLGMLTSAVESTFRSNLNLMRALSGVKSGPLGPDGERYNTRQVGRVRELTATSSEDVSKVLDDMGIHRSQENSIGLCFATSMVEVGLDVPRLGLMTVMGQPKSASQYIQVTGRVGRSNHAPGFVVTVLNSRVARDRAHYEDFRHWHERLYASVESTSVTPFTTRALERSLASVLVAMCRIMGTGSNPQDTILSYWNAAIEVLQRRASNMGPEAVNALQRVSQSLLGSLQMPEVAQMKWTPEDDGNLDPFIFQIGSVPPGRASRATWQILNSMRSVDQDASVKTLAMAVAAGGQVPKSPQPDDTEEM